MRLVDDAILEAVYQRDVRHALFRNARSSGQPRLVIVGGQPGAGKTSNVLRARHELAAAGEGVAFINGDELRNFHPLYDQLVAADAATAADKTGADVGWWVEKGIREAADNRFHTVIETTMRQPSVVARTVNTFAARGYQIEMRVLVVDPELSRQGIYHRYAKALNSKNSLPRFTLPQYHDDALAQMPHTLAAITPLVHSVRFVDRQGGELYASGRSAQEPAAALRRLRQQSLPAAELGRISQEWSRLVSALDQQGISDVVRAGVRQEQQRFALQSALQPAQPTRGIQGPQR